MRMCARAWSSAIENTRFTPSKFADRTTEVAFWDVASLPDATLKVHTLLRITLPLWSLIFKVIINYTVTSSGFSFRVRRASHVIAPSYSYLRRNVIVIVITGYAMGIVHKSHASSKKPTTHRYRASSVVFFFSCFRRDCAYRAICAPAFTSTFGFRGRPVTFS